MQGPVPGPSFSPDPSGFPSRNARKSRGEGDDGATLRIESGGDVLKRAELAVGQIWSGSTRLGDWPLVLKIEDNLRTTAITNDGHRSYAVRGIGNGAKPDRNMALRIG